jgi:DNA-binding CsgD family transcriptional regulator
MLASMESAGQQIDRATSAALERLSAREKECLRRFLLRQTAKEMALELGISHHAVEKRLKQARIKLGAATSLDAARLLGELEGYGRTASGSPDLANDPPAAQSWLTRPRIMGAMVMSILSAIILAVAAQSGGTVSDTAAGVEKSDNSDIPRIVMAKASPEQVEAYVTGQFAELDKDKSGYIEQDEGPASIQLGCCANDPSDTLTGVAAWRHVLKDNGDDGDDRVSFAEYRNARYDRLLSGGIPVERDRVVAIGDRPSPYGEQTQGEGNARVFTADLKFVKVSEARVRAYVRTMFDDWDKDGSGFVELAEAPAQLGTPKATMAPDGTVTYDRNDPLTELTGDAARAQYIENVDRDGDGKVSFEEYAKPVMPQYLERGIPLIPADWKQANAAGDRKE